MVLPVSSLYRQQNLLVKILSQIIFKINYPACLSTGKAWPEHEAEKLTAICEPIA
jgi:hypothetical protein